MTNCTALVSISPFAIVPQSVQPFSWIEAIPRAVDYAATHLKSPSLMSFREQGRFKEGMLFRHGMFQGRCADGTPSNPSVRNNLRLNGTYTMDGELVFSASEKGVFLDCLG